jgi:hypothetical protein
MSWIRILPVCRVIDVKQVPNTVECGDQKQAASDLASHSFATTTQIVTMERNHYTHSTSLAHSTHSYLSERDNPAQCAAYGAHHTVEHLVV